MTPEQLRELGIHLFNQDGRIGVATQDKYGFTSGAYGPLDTSGGSNAGLEGIDVNTLDDFETTANLYGIDRSRSKGVAPGMSIQTLISAAQSNRDAQAARQVQEQQAAQGNLNTPGFNTAEQQNAPGTQVAPNQAQMDANRNALLPQGVQPGQAFGEAAQNPALQQTNAIDPVTGQPIDATLSGQQVGGRLGTQQFGRVGNDVFEIMSDGSRRKVTEAEFSQKLRAQGLNLQVLPQLDLNDNLADTPGGMPDFETNIDGTPKGPGDFLSDYKNIIKELGLSDIKKAFDNLQSQYIDLQDKKNEEIASVNDNPWLSESIRLKEVNKINTKYELKENTLSNQQKLYDSLYQEGLAEARYIATGVQEDRNKMLDMALKAQEAEDDLRQQGFDNEMDLLKLDLDERKLKLDALKASQDGSTGNDPANLLAYAQQYASSGKIPTGMPKGTFGLISQLAASLPKPAGTLIDLSTGVKPDVGDAKIDAYSALFDLTKKLTEAQGLFEESGTGIGFGLLSTIKPTSDQQKYNNLRTEITDLLARARTGAALTREEEEFYRSRMPGLFSESLFLGASGEQKLIDLQKQITDTLKTKLAAQGLGIVGFGGNDPAAQFDQ